MQTQLGADDRAIASLQSAVEIAPNEIFARRALGRALAKQARFRDAEPHLRWCLARDPDDQRVRTALFEATKERLASGSHSSPSSHSSQE